MDSSIPSVRTRAVSRLDVFKLLASSIVNLFAADCGYITIRHIGQILMIVVYDNDSVFLLELLQVVDTQPSANSSA